jgi:23S rRNA pseudouridine1911/1915/1917 synthase
MPRFMIEPFTVTAEQTNLTIGALLRLRLPDQTWSQIRRIIEARRVLIDDGPCMDPARRVKEGDPIQVLDRPAPHKIGESAEDLAIRHLDDDIVVVEKASGVNTVRHPEERDWDERKKAMSPTLEDITQKAIAKRLGTQVRFLPRLRIVHRLDKDTSGLVVFARSVDAERELGRQFHRHTVIRRYQAIVRGYLESQRIESNLVRDRGDGRRGSGPADAAGKRAITHVTVFECLPQHTILNCQLETGRTHQIRIHLSEKGYPVCGEKVYNRGFAGKKLDDPDEAPRLALHALELGFIHPKTLVKMHWEMPLPVDLQGFLARVRRLPRTEMKPRSRR